MKKYIGKVKSWMMLVFLCQAITTLAQDTAMYLGGYHDGYSMISQNNFTPANLPAFAVYQGGSQDGYSSSLLPQYTPVILSSQGMYLGASGDGYTQNALTQFTPGMLSSQGMYLGASGDGYSSTTQQNFTPTLLAHNYMYLGNSGDGYTSLTQSQFTPAYLTHYTPYAGGQGDGYAGTLIVGVVLPIRLLSFDGKTTDRGNLLEWKVSMEKDVASYDLQRSGEATSFSQLYTKEVSSSSMVKKTYNYLDTEPLDGANYYRLQINDDDGKVSYSNVVLLISRKDKQSVAIYPNPAQDILMLKYRLNAKTFMRITDIKGSILTNKELPEGENTIEIPVSHFAQGVYMLQLVSENGFNKSIRFIKQ